LTAQGQPREHTQPVVDRRINAAIGPFAGLEGHGAMQLHPGQGRAIEEIKGQGKALEAQDPSGDPND